MARLLSSENGIEEWFDYDPINDQMIIQTRQDVTPFLETMHAKRQMNLWQKEVKNDLVHYSKMTPTVELHMMEKGIDLCRLNDPAVFKKFDQEMRANFPYYLSHPEKRFA